MTGSAYTAGDSAYHAFLYSNGKMIDLGTLPNSRNSFPVAMNALGQVTGNTTMADEVPVHAFLYSNGRMSDLGTLVGSYSFASAINVHGQVTGTASTAGNAAYHGLSVQSGIGMVDLNNLVVSGSPSPGFYLARPSSYINDSGVILAGGSDNRTYMLKPGVE